MGILAVMSISLLIAIKKQKLLVETFALSMMLCSLAIYICSFAMPLNYPVYAINVISIVCLIYAIWLLVRSKQLIANKSITVSFILVISMTLFMLLFSQGRDIASPDEYYCWGWMTKGFYYNDSLSAGYSSNITGIHPPFTTLWYYYILKNWICFSDSMCIFANNILMLALLFPILSYTVKSNKVLQIVLATALIVLIPYIGDSYAYTSILVDFIQGGLVFYALYCLVRIIDSDVENAYFYYSALIVAIQCIILSKRSGVFISSLLIGIVSFIAVRVREKITNRSVVFLTIISALVTASWFKLSAYDALPILFAVAGFGIGAYLKRDRICSNRYYVDIILGLLGGGTLGAVYLVNHLDEFVRKCSSTYLYDLFSIYSKVNGLLPIPYGYWVLIAFIMACLITRLVKGEEGSSYKYLLSAIGGAMIIYSIALLYFHIKEVGPANNGLDHIVSRYYLPFIIGVFGLSVIFFMKITTDRYNLRVIGLLMGCIIVLIGGSGTSLMENFFVKHNALEYHAFEEANIELTSDDCIYFVDEVDDDGWRDREFYYCMYPAKTNFYYADHLNSDGVGILQYSVEEFSGILNEYYNYVYLQTISSDFEQRYGRLFEDSSSIMPGHAYEVKKENGIVKLVLINS
ncbi:MAG: hypothetical protein K5754_04675 [Butyrivibrio sp.]|jgi:hypothetical protein|nr:hypothetical protein [Butyrivibrio sp.]